MMISFQCVWRRQLLSLFLLLSCAQAEVLITEFMASNQSTLNTLDGGTPDWIEIHNSGTSPVQLADFALSMDETRLNTWALPQRNLAGDGYVIVYASGEDRSEQGGELHANFKLSKEAGYLALIRRDDASVLSEYHFPEQLEDVSYGLAQTGSVETITLLDEGRPCRVLVPSGPVTNWQAADFNDGAWRAATTGVGYERGSGYEDLIGSNSDVESAMYDQGSSVYVRTPFQVASKAEFVGLTLRMKYDDGFVAYLNGDRVASAFAPATLAWNSAATDQNDDGAAVTFQDFSMNDVLDQLRVGTNVLAIHGLNRNTTSSDLLFLPAVQALRQRDAQIGAADYFLEPSPGEPNGTNQGLPSDPVTFSTSGRSFTGALSLTLTSDSPDGEIRYTTNGRLPTSASTRFAGAPISVTSSTLVRARVFETGKAPGPISEEAYIRLASNVTNFSSDLPVVVLDRIGNNESASNGKASVFWAIFEPGAAGGRTRLLGDYTLGTRAGYKVRGSSSTGFAKQSWSIEAWDEANSNKNIRPLGMPSESDWILSGRYTFDRALMRNPFIYELSNQIGRYAVRTRFVEVYLNTNGGDLQSSDYHGVYTLMEKISRDADRVDVERLPEGVTTEPGITGGYVLKIDRADPGDNGFSGAGQSLRYVYPKEEDVTVAQGNWIRDYMNAFGDALNGPNFGDPLLGYEPFIDVDAFIDHHLLNVLTLNADALRLSTYMFKPRDGKLQMGPIWDFDRAMGSTDGRDANPSTWQGGTNYFTYPWWNRLFANENFWQRYIDRYMELRQGAFSTSNIHRILDGFAGELQESQVRNFQRWTSVPPRFGGYQGEVNHLKDWLETRAEWMDDQFLTSPRADKSPGVLNAGEQVRLTSPSLSAGREIRYTLDGSDPRSQVTPVVVEGTTLLDENAAVRALIPRSNISADWRTSPSFNDNTWLSGSNGVGYDDNTTYNAFIRVNLEGANVMKGVNTSAYMRLKFNATADQVARFNFMSLQMRYDDGFVAYLNGTKIAEANAPNSPSWNAGATSTNDDGAAVTFESFDAKAGLPSLRAGTNLLAIHGLNSGNTSSDFLIQAKIIAGEQEEGPGQEGEALTYSGPITLTKSAILTARIYDPAGGNSINSGRTPVGTGWSAPLTVRYFIDEEPASSANLAVTELMVEPPKFGDGTYDRKAYEYIELTNVGAKLVSLSEVRLVDGIEFTFPDITINAGERVLVVKNLDAFQEVYGPAAAGQVVGTYEGQLGNGGDAFRLMGADGAPISTVAYESSAGTGPLEIDAITGQWQASAAPLGTPGSETLSGTLSVHVNEVLSNSEPPAVDAVELFNSDTSAIDISGWFLTDDLQRPRQFRIPDGTLLDSSAFAVFSEDQFGGFALSSMGDEVFLIATDVEGRFDGRMDAFAFGAAPVGATYGRVINSLDEESTSRLKSATLGTANQTALVGPLIFTELMVHPALDEDEFIEIANIGPDSVDLANARVNGAGFTFTEASLDPGQILILTSNPTEFRDRHNLPDNILVRGPLTARLDNSGETLTLLLPDPVEPDLLIPSDQVTYQTNAPWPMVNGNGRSLERSDLTAFGSDPVVWSSSAIEGGSPGTHEGLSSPEPEPEPTGDSWKASFFSPDQLSDTSITGDLADPDGDGWPNMLEYALGRHPLEHSSETLLEADHASLDGQQRLRLKYLTRTPLPFHRVTLESSRDLEVWENTPDQFGEPTEILLDNGLLETTRFWIGLPPDEKIHVRLRVDRLAN